MLTVPVLYPTKPPTWYLPLTFPVAYDVSILPPALYPIKPPTLYDEFVTFPLAYEPVTFPVDVLYPIKPPTYIFEPVIVAVL